MEPSHQEHDAQPGPSLWPVGVAVGIATLLVGLILSWLVAAVGAALVLVFGFLWVRELMTGRDAVAEARDVADEGAVESATGPAVPAPAGGPAMPPGERFPRSRFLEGATLGLGLVIGGLVTVPAVGFAVAPAFLDQDHPDIDLGPLDNFPEGEFRVATFMEDPSKGDVSRRTVFVRNNGFLGAEPSFTIISNRCAHLGCPVQPGGPIADNQAKTIKTVKNVVTLIPVTPAGFGCPCHGGSYDTEGNRTAGPPTHALDRWTFKVVQSRLVLIENFSVAKVEGRGAAAKIEKYTLTGPGQHVTGPESWLYPVQPPH